MQDIDWNYFPEPYNKELPFYFEKALERFTTPEGIELLNFLLEAARKQTTGGRLPKANEERATELMQALSEWEFQAFVALNKHLMKATEAGIEEAQGKMDLLHQFGAIRARARELEPSLPDNATLRQEVEVLKRHGEPVGISDEVLEMRFEIPPSSASAAKEEEE